MTISSQRLQKVLRLVLFLFYISLTIISAYSILLGVKNFNGDNYFMFSHAKLILQDGFTTIEPLTMHEGLYFLYPQWLYAVIIYLLKIHLGNTSIAVFAVLMYLLIFLSFYKLCLTITNENKNSLFLTTFCFFFFTLTSATIRPYTITILLLILETLYIEKYIKKPDKRYFIILFILSILQINIHNSLWISSSLIVMCYIGEWVLNKFLGKQERFNLKDFICIELIILVGGFINPYGYKYITYIFSSMSSIKPFFGIILELRAPRLINPFYPLVLILFVLICWTHLIKKIDIPYSYIFMFFGFSLMSMMASRNLIFFFTFALLPIVYLSQFLPSFTNNILIFHKISTLGFVLLFLILTICITIPEYKESDNSENVINWTTDNIGKQESTMFTSFNSGSYAEYKGNYKTYIDARAEVFGLSNNKKADIVGEYMDVYNSKAELNELINKYNFDFVLIDSSISNISEFRDNNKYSLLYGKEKSLMYERKQNT